MIKFVDVSKTYPNGVQALKKVNLEIHDGEFVGIIGLAEAVFVAILPDQRRGIALASEKYRHDFSIIQFGKTHVGLQ